MNALTAALKEELNVDMVTVFGLSIPESVVVSWGIMAFLVIGLHPADAESAGGSHHQAAGHPGNGRYYDQ